MKFPKKEILEANRILDLQIEQVQENGDQIRHQLSLLKKFIQSDPNPKYLGSCLFHISSIIAKDAFIKRIINNDIQFFISALSTCSRLSFLKDKLAGRNHSGGYDCLHAFNILKAASINEHEVINSYLNNFKPPFKHGHKSTVLLCNGLYAVFSKHPYKEEVIKQLQERKETNFFRAMYDCLTGLLKKDEAIFLQGYLQLLKNNKKQNHLSKLEKSICLTAHAFKHIYEQNSDLNQSIFEEKQKLPFDQGFNDFLRESQTHKPLDISSQSNVLNDCIIDLTKELSENELLNEIMGKPNN